MSVEKRDIWPKNIKKASQITVKKIEEAHQDNSRSKEIEDEDADKDADKDADEEIEDEDREEDPLEFEQHSATKSKALKTKPRAHEQQYEN